MATINTPREFVEYIQNAPAFDLASVKPWERETLSPYLGYPKDWPTRKAATMEGKHDAEETEL